MAGLRGLPRKVAMVIYPDVLLLDATGPVQVFSSANEEVARRFGGDTVAYQVEMLGPHEGPVKTAAGVLLVADRSFAEARDAFDTVLIAGGSGVLKMIHDTSVTGWVCDISRQCRRIGSVCTGAFLLAAAGLLDGRRATTHWVHLEDFAERFPKVDVEPDAIFVQD
ncbi:MAG: DJ-1/PfpI family protein, partial [Minwuiales bacterium]|nr:DJ-1/PfpI family protein [Minwuiales bacterium]